MRVIHSRLGNGRVTVPIAATALITIIVTFAAVWMLNSRQLALRQAEVAARGAGVMPFDLDRTTHIFERLTDGGLQTVRADDPADTRQIALIRQHLQEEAEKFRRGDFSDPRRIHGIDMPGLAELQAGASRIQIMYTPLPDGGQLRYTAQDQALVTALHRWFTAQVSDHGQHATEHRIP